MEQGAVVIEIAELNEKLATYNNVVNLTINYEADSYAYDMVLTISKDIFDERVSLLKIHFSKISSLKVFEFNSGVKQFMNMTISQSHDGLENVKYHVRQVEDDDIYFNCFGIQAEIIEALH